MNNYSAIILKRWTKWVVIVADILSRRAFITLRWFWSMSATFRSGRRLGRPAVFISPRCRPDTAVRSAADEADQASLTALVRNALRFL